MKQGLWLTAILLSGFFSGCQNNHLTNKQAAEKRWNRARARINVDLARQQFQAGQSDQALAAVQKAVKTDPDNLEAYLLMGEIFLEQNRHLPAQRCFETCLTLNPSHPEAHYRLGIVYEKRELLDEALAGYRRAWEIQPEHSPYLLALVEMMVARQHHRQALDLLNQHITDKGVADPDPAIFLAAGNILSSLGDKTEAILMFRKAAHLAPDSQIIMESLGFALLEADRPQEAAQLFEKRMQHIDVPSLHLHWPLQLALGDCYLRLGRYHEAQRCFEKVTKYDPANPGLWTRLGQVCLARKQLDQAQKYTQKALSLQADYPEALLLSACLALNRQDYPPAIRLTQKVISRDRDNVLAYCIQGQACQAQGRFEQAAECYRQALRVSSQDQLAKRLLASLNTTNVSEMKNSKSF